MIILVLGDVVGPPGCEHVAKVLPGLKAEYSADMVIVNGENSADGNGIVPQSARKLFDSGVDVITTGNHVLRRRQIYDTLDEKSGLIRPANYHRAAPGSGMFMFDHLRFRVLVINLQGIVFMNNIENPFDCIDRMLEEADTPNIIVDFHAEATAEKECMGFYLDGRVSAVLGTHTHVPTADARILKGGTAYVTDIGMCGGRNSVLGVKAELAVEKMLTGLPVRFETETEDIALSGVVLDINESTGKCRKIEQILYR